MIHLLMAYKVKPNGSTLFYIGNLAPDAVTNWKDKDITGRFEFSYEVACKVKATNISNTENTNGKRNDCFRRE